MNLNKNTVYIRFNSKGRVTYLFSLSQPDNTRYGGDVPFSCER